MLRCVPDVKEEFAPPLSSMPGQFPVYLRLPYRRDYYFCFRLEARQAGFLSILSACIRHQNQGGPPPPRTHGSSYQQGVGLGLG